MYGIFTHIWLIFMVNVANIPYMDPMGYILTKCSHVRTMQRSQKVKVNCPSDPGSPKLRIVLDVIEPPQTSYSDSLGEGALEEKIIKNQ